MARTFKQCGWTGPHSWGVAGTEAPQGASVQRSSQGRALEISWTHLFPGDHDFVIPLTTKPNSEASLQLSLLKHALAPAPSAVCDRLPPEQMPPGKGHVPQSSQSCGEARKVGSEPWWLAAGCPAASPGAFCSSKTHFWALSSCREYPGTGRGVSTAEELSDPLLCLVLLPPHRISSSVLAQMAPPGSSQTAPAAPVLPQQPLTPQGHAHCDLCHCPQAPGPSDCRGTAWRPNSSSSNQF